MHMDAADLSDIITDDALNVKSEQQTFEAVVRWIDVDNATRARYTPELLRRIRLGLVSMSYFIDNVSSNVYVVGSGGKCDSTIQVWSANNSWNSLQCERTLRLCMTVQMQCHPCINRIIGYHSRE
jgi:hypothetical protein